LRISSTSLRSKPFIVTRATTSSKVPSVLTHFSLLQKAIPDMEVDTMDDDEFAEEGDGPNTILKQMYFSMFTKVVLPWDMFVVGIASISALLRGGDEIFFGKESLKA
jgi:hypothetical protein